MLNFQLLECIGEILTYELRSVISDNDPRDAKYENNELHKEFNHFLFPNPSQWFGLYPLCCIVDNDHDELCLVFRFGEWPNYVDSPLKKRTRV